jgi:4'-phosphopantetheinyl transferase EntD
MLGSRFAVATAATSLVNDQLFPQELSHIAGAGAKRQAEFGTARVCARQALARLGIASCALVPNPDRSPFWPSGIRGSISHAAGQCAVVVSNASDVIAVGVDFEPNLALDRDLERLICTRAEINWLASFDPKVRGYLGKVLFCAKEAFYKCQYPLTATILDFTDVVLAIDTAKQTFTVVSVSKVCEQWQGYAGVCGQFRQADELIIATAVLSQPG